MSNVLLSEEETQKRLMQLNNESDGGWAIFQNQLHKKYVFKNFHGAILFVTRCAVQCEAMDHHPDWANHYNTVDVSLTTHRAGGLTELDFRLAEFMEKTSANI